MLGGNSGFSGALALRHTLHNKRIARQPQLGRYVAESHKQHLRLRIVRTTVYAPKEEPTATKRIILKIVGATFNVSNGRSRPLALMSGYAVWELIARQASFVSRQPNSESTAAN